MRPHAILLLALTLLIACTSAVLAEAPDRSVTAFSSEVEGKRLLRAAKATETDEDDDDDDLTDEERGLMTKFKFWRLRRSAGKELKAAEKVAAKAAAAAAKAEKAEANTQALLTKSLDKDVAPAKIYKWLGLKKMPDEKAVTSPNWKYYEDYLEKYHQKWSGARR